MRHLRALLGSIVLAGLVGIASPPVSSARADTISNPDCMEYAPAGALANPPVTCTWIEDVVNEGEHYGDAGCFQLIDISDPWSSANPYGRYILYMAYDGWTYTDGNGVYYDSWMSDGSAGPYHIVARHGWHECEEY